MTTQAKPLFYFNNIIFNTSYFDTEIDKSLKNYVNYDPTNTKLISNVNYIPTDITSLTLTTIGQNDTINNQFNLPTNTFEANPKSILQLVNNTSRNTQWVTPATVITDYVNYSNPNLISNVSGTPTTITDLVMSASIGSSTAQKFILPSNSSTATTNSVLTINATTKATTWTVIPQISNYTNYDNTAKTLISNVSGTPTTITDLAVSKIGATNAQIFSLPTNTSSVSAGQILSILNASTKTTQWINSPPIINNYMSYNTSTNQIINNVSGTTTTISGLNIGNLTCNAIDTQNSTINCGGGDVNAGTITASVNLVSTGGASVSGLSSLTGGIIINAVNDYKFASTGAIRGTTINGTILSASTQLTTSTINPFSPTSEVNFCNIQTGIINIASATNRTGSINIGTGLTTGSGDVNIGSNNLSTGTQNVNINRPLTCKSINTQSSDVNCGTGLITCGGATINGNLSTGTGNITGGILFINGIGVNGNNTDVLGNINLGTGNLKCGVMISNSISTGAVNAGSSLIQTTGGLQSNYADILGIVYNKGIVVRDSTYTTEMASIINTGWITCKNTDIAQTMYSRGIEIRNASNTASLTVDTNGNLNTPGNINCALIDVGNTVYCRYLAVRDVGNTLDIIKLNQNGTIDCNIVKTTVVQCPFYESNPTNSGSIDIGIFNTTGNLNIFQNNTTGNINIGNGGLIGVSQKINIKRPMTIHYLTPQDYSYLGGTQAVTNFSLEVPNNSVKTIGTITDVPGGNYMIFYSVSYTFLLSTKTFTLQQYGITSTLDSFSTIYGKCYDLETTSQIRTADVDGNSRFTKTFSNLITVIGTTSNIRLTVGLSYTIPTENVTVNGSMKLMRIG